MHNIWRKVSTFSSYKTEKDKKTIVSKTTIDPDIRFMNKFQNADQWQRQHQKYINLFLIFCVSFLLLTSHKYAFSELTVLRQSSCIYSIVCVLFIHVLQLFLLG